MCVDVVFVGEGADGVWAGLLGRVLWMLVELVVGWGLVGFVCRVVGRVGRAGAGERPGGADGDLGGGGKGPGARTGRGLPHSWGSDSETW